MYKRYQRAVTSNVDNIEKSITGIVHILSVYDSGTKNSSL